MSNPYQPTANLNSREDFYRATLLRYKREKERAKEAEEKKIEGEIQEKNLRLERMNFKKREKSFSFKEKVNHLDNYLDSSLKRPKENLASRIKDKNSYELDGGLFSRVDKGIEDVGESYFRYPSAADVANMPDDVDDERAVRENFDKVKKETKDKILEARKRAREAKEAQKAAKAGGEAAKAAKGAEAGAQAAKAGVQAAKAAKSLGLVFNIGKFVSALFSLETMAISLLITILFWLIQVVGHEWMGIEWIPKMEWYDWAGFIACVVIVIYVLGVALAPLVAVVAIIGG